MEDFEINPEFIRSLMPPVVVDPNSRAVNELIQKCDLMIIAEAKKGKWWTKYRVMQVEIGIANFDTQKVFERMIKYYQEKKFIVKNLHPEEKHTFLVSWKSN